jgi:hypothetical protein
MLLGFSNISKEGISTPSHPMEKKVKKSRNNTHKPPKVHHMIRMFRGKR